MDSSNSILQELDFFKTLDDDQSFTDLKKELIIECCDSFPDLVKSLSFEKGIVEIDYYDFESGTPQVFYYNFYEELPSLVDSKVRKIKNVIDAQVSSFISENKDLQVFFKNLEAIIVALANLKYKLIPNRDEITLALANVLEYLQDRYGYNTEYKLLDKLFKIDIESYNPNSYRWLTVNSDRGISKLKKLYSLLSEEPKIIDCSESEFVNAFTQSKLTDGIRWCVRGKNGQYSKQSLIQFIDTLMSEKYIESKDAKGFNDALRYIFRDDKGQQIKNISISKSASTNTPSGWERIRAVIDELE